jgi:GNAT superfamily N-acetyltransferase
MERYHYRAGRPATRVRVLAAWDDRGGRVGELWVSMPALNAPWRARAWPELFGSHPRGRVVAALVNAHVRTISRVVVLPRARGTGVASSLVRAYLRDPITPMSEALASMGRFCPLFESAGMRSIECEASRRDRAWADALRVEGIEAWEMVDVARAERALAHSAALRAAVIAWARGSKSTRGLVTGTRGNLVELAARAACGLAGGARVYVSP